MTLRGYPILPGSALSLLGTRAGGDPPYRLPDRKGGAASDWARDCRR